MDVINQYRQEIDVANVLIRYLDESVLEHEQANRGAVLALIAETHTCSVGKPGVAKTMTMETIEKVLSMKTFSKQLSETDTFQVLIGMPSVSAMRDRDSYEYRTDQMIWNSHVVMLDEWQRVNGAFRGSVLQWMVQRTLTNGSHAYTTPLISVFGASNSLPEEDCPLYDRFVLRYQVELPSEQAMDKLLRDKFSSNRIEPDVPDSMTLQQLKTLQEARSQIVITQDILSLMRKIAYKLINNGVYVSPRKIMEAGKVVQANALLNGNNEADEDDLSILQHIFWGKLEHRQNVASVLYEMAAGVMTKAQSIMDEALNIIEKAKVDIPELRRTSGIGPALNALGSEMEKVDSAYTALENIAGDLAKHQKSPEKVQKLLKKLDEAKLNMSSLMTSR